MTIGIDRAVHRRPNRLARLDRPGRLTLLALLAVMLVLRLGPVCEAVARAAPVAADMTGCEGSRKPAKTPQPAACSTPCMTVRGEAPLPAAPAAPIRATLKPLPVAGLTGMPVPPATPPPRTV